MLNAFNISVRSDLFGAAASALCLAHCLATPFLFAAHTGHVHGHEASPFWWGTLDLVFIAISWLAVYWSAKHTSKKWMRVGLWISWVLLAFVILNEKFELLHIPEAAIYIPSLALVGLHLYNRKYCQCQDEACCATDS